MPRGRSSTGYRIALDVSGVGVLENYRIDVARGVIRYARQHTDWELLYNLGDFSLIHWYERFDDLPRLRADGIIFSYWEEERVRALERLGIPMVCLSNLEPRLSASLPCVLSDDRAAGRLAARHFIERGFQHYAFYGDVEGRRWEAERHRGYTEELSLAGHDCHAMQGQVFADPPRAAKRLDRWLAGLPRPVAVFGATDARAFHVLEACLSLGLEVPTGVAILGVDNNPFYCEAQGLGLSSVAPDAERVGMEAAALLHSMLRGAGNPAEQIVVPPIGVVTRASSDVIAADDAALSRALLFIRNHHREPLAMARIVRASGVSRSTLERRFRDRLGMTINEALRRQRLETAKHLLSDRSLSLDGVAAACGFRRATYLCNVFREEEQTTPGEWRARGG